MRKHLILILIAAFILAPTLNSTPQLLTKNPKPFLNAAINVAAGATVTHPATMQSRALKVDGYSTCSIQVEFDRAAGAADTVNIEFWSTQDGVDYSLFREAFSLGEELIQIPTETAVVAANTVRVTFILDVRGLQRLRIGSVENSDGVNNITAFNVYLGLGSNN